MGITHGSAGDLKKGSYIVIDGEPCVVLDVSKSKPGKHGAAKVRIDARGLFDGNRRSRIFPAGADVEIPIIDKRTGQVLSVSGNVVQIMDMENYEDVFEVPLDELDPEIRERLSPGVEVEYWVALGRRKVVRIR